jgi:HEAT repeat protein
MPSPRGRFLVAALAGLSLLALGAAPASAHGGKYRPPGEDPDPPERDPPAKVKPPGEPNKPKDPTPGQGGTPTPPDVRAPKDVPTPTPPSNGGTPTLPPGTVDPRQRAARRARVESLEEWSAWWFYTRDRWLLRPANRAASGTASLGETASTEEASPVDAAAALQKAWRDRALVAIRRSFPDSDVEIFTGAALALGKGGDLQDAAALLRALEGRYADGTVRESLVLALGLLGKEAPGGRAALTEILKDRDDTPRLRGMAAVALGIAGDPAAVPVLLAAAHEKSATRDLASGALVGLGLLKEPLVVPDLVEILEDERNGDAKAIRGFAAYALGRIGGPEAARALGRALGDSDPRLRRAAILALGECDPASSAFLAPILGKVAHEDRDRPCRNFAMVSLGRIGGAAASDALSRAYSLGDRGERNFAALGLGLYGRGLKGKDEEARGRIAFLLRNDFLNREDADLRGALAVGLALLGDAKSIAPFREVLRDRGAPDLRAHCAIALGLLGAKEAATELRAVLVEKGNPALQREAGLALGILGDAAAAKPLATLVGDSSAEFVRASAAAALGYLGGDEASRALEALLADRAASGAARGQAAVGIGLLVDPRDPGALATISPGLDYLDSTSVLMEILTIP